MTRDDDFTRLLEQYLDEYEGSTPLPQGVQEAVRARFRSTMQDGPSPWSAWAPNTFALFGLGATALVVAAAVGIGLFAAGGNPNVGGPTPSADPTSGFSDPAAPSPAPQVAAVYARGTDPSITVMVAVPDGWQNPGHAVTTGTGSAHAGISFWTIGTVYIDPCNWGQGEVVEVPADGAANTVVSGLVAAWAPDTGSAVATAPSVSEPRAAMLDGYRGQYLELTAPSDIDFAGCDGGAYRLWLARDDAARFLQAPGRVQRLWFLEVGTQVLVVDATYTPVANDDPDRWHTVLGQLEALIGTLDIQTPEE